MTQKIRQFYEILFQGDHRKSHLWSEPREQNVAKMHILLPSFQKRINFIEELVPWGLREFLGKSQYLKKISQCWTESKIVIPRKTVWKNKKFALWKLCTVWKLHDLVSHIFGKNFVKVTFLLKSWFDKIFFGETKFSSFYTAVCNT